MDRGQYPEADEKQDGPAGHLHRDLEKIVYFYVNKVSGQTRMVEYVREVSRFPRPSIQLLA